MKRLNKKGFTIIELVIVIAVIAILAAVLIPTFTNVIAKANESKALQQARSAYEEILAIDLADGKLDGKGTVDGRKVVVMKEEEAGTPAPEVIDEKVTTYTVSGDKLSNFTYSVDGYTVTFNGTDWTITD